jgi:hypothetical protein
LQKCKTKRTACPNKQQSSDEHTTTTQNGKEAGAARNCNKTADPLQKNETADPLQKNKTADPLQKMKTNHNNRTERKLEQHEHTQNDYQQRTNWW